MIRYDLNYSGEDAYMARSPEGEFVKFDDVVKLLDKAAQLASIASDWNLNEVEINGKMVSIYKLKKEFENYAK